MDREAWTHAVVSAAIVIDMDKDVCRSARIVLGGVAPIPWRLPEVEKMLAGQRITKDLAAKAGEQAVAGARPLAKNGYKVPLTRAMVARTIRRARGAVVRRRDFLFLRPGEPAVLSCEQLFMRFLDSQMNGSTAELFAGLAHDLRAAKSLRLTETSWLSRDDLKHELNRVLAGFTAAGGRIVVAMVVALVLPHVVAAAPQAKASPKSGASMCVLTAADFAGAGVQAPMPSKTASNVSDAGASVYCTYTKNSGAFSGVELDVFNPAGGGTVADAKDTLKTATSEGHPAPTPIAIAGADEALWSPKTASGSVPFAMIAVRRAALVFVLSIPEHKDSKAQLTKLAALILQRL